MFLCMYLYDMCGFGMVNVFVVFELGVVIFDILFGGFGGCLVMKGVSGNVVMEDFVNFCDEFGLEIGVVVVGVWFVLQCMQEFFGCELLSKILYFGICEEFYVVNWEV